MVEPFFTGRGRRNWSRLPARSVLLHTLYAVVSTGDPLLACRLGRCFCILVCRGLHRRPAPHDTLRVPRFHFLHIQKTANTAKAVLAVLAGAEGLEPSALGFGVAVEIRETFYN